jgi:hypothetical protein
MSDDTRRNGGCGCGVGGFIAIYLSWITNHSIIWCLIHGFLGWLYVIYWLLTGHLK